GMQAGEVAVNLKFDGLGAKKFATVTGNNIKRQLAIVLDNQVVSAPVIQTRIPNGNAQITGLDDFNEAKQLAVVLRAGALPLPMTIGELRSVGATLGEDYIRSGMNAALVGLLLVAVFMVAYYRKTGFWAIFALAFNLLLIGAVMSTFHAVLTMPGLAGVVLTIGMAVDAHVLVYERIREELRNGRTVRMAIQAGFEKAFSAIVDANVTTLLTAFVLYKIGSGPIKGFGLTLMIGIAASMFTALYVTRWLFMITGDASSDGTKLSIGKAILVDAKFAIVPNIRKAVLFSAALVLVSFALFGFKGLNYGIDFTGGNVLTVAFQQEASSEQIARAIGGKTSLGTPTVRTVDVLDSKTPTFLVSIMKTTDDGADVPAVEKALSEAGIPGTVINEELVGPAIGKQLKSSAAWAILWSLLIMIGYIWFRFGKFGLGFGLGAVVALAHDITLTLGVFALTGIALDSTMIAALLTIVGYSINDTIVIYDRIRENTQILGKETFGHYVNNSINQCLSRTLMTSMTTLLVTLSLMTLGGVSIHDFALAMTTGVLVGTWSSNFVAPAFVLWWTGRYGIKRKAA
ncbi:MAG: protein translocase subunit SecD, partial [Fibrobacterales bacterium]|nr:protein translocase subunit SecD [Fibrobacterales bacterium]